MKKIMLLIVTLTIMVFPVVRAADVLSIDASESTSGEVSVSGTVDSSMVAAAVLVYDENGENMVTMKTTQVNDDNTFSTTVALSAGTYVVKVADYTGGQYKTVKVSPNSSSSTGSVNPKTGDNIMFYGIIGLVSLVGFSIVALYFRKVAKTSK